MIATMLALATQLVLMPQPPVSFGVPCTNYPKMCKYKDKKCISVINTVYSNLKKACDKDHHQCVYNPSYKPLQSFRSKRMACHHHATHQACKNPTWCIKLKIGKSPNLSLYASCVKTCQKNAVDACKRKFNVKKVCLTRALICNFKAKTWHTKSLKQCDKKGLQQCSWYDKSISSGSTYSSFCKKYLYCGPCLVKSNK